MRFSADFSAETLEARRKQHNLFKAMEEKKLQIRILYPAKELQTSKAYDNEAPPNQFYSEYERNFSRL